MVRDLLWVLIQETALAVTIIAVYAGLGRPSRSEAMLATAMIIIFLPIRESVFEGQVAVVLTMLMVLAWLAQQRGRPVLGGLSMAVAVALKLTPALLLPYLLWRRSYRLVATVVLGTGAFVVATYAIGWSQRWTEYLPFSRMLGRGTAFIANQSLNGALLRIARPEFNGLPIPALPLWITAVWVVLIVLLIALLVIGIRHLDLPQVEWRWTEFSLVLLALPLLQPFAWFHHHAAAIVAIIVAVRLARHKLLPIWATAGAGTAYILVTLVAYPVHRLARNLTGTQLEHNVGLRLSTSVTVLAVLIAMFCLSRAHAGQTEST